MRSTGFLSTRVAICRKNICCNAQLFLSQRLEKGFQTAWSSKFGNIPETFPFGWPYPQVTLDQGRSFASLLVCVCVCVSLCMCAGLFRMYMLVIGLLQETSRAACCFWVWRRGKRGVKDGPVGPEPNHESLSKYGGGGITLVVWVPPFSVDVFSLLCPCLDNSVQCCAISSVVQSRSLLYLRIHYCTRTMHWYEFSLISCCHRSLFHRHDPT